MPHCRAYCSSALSQISPIFHALPANGVAISQEPFVVKLNEKRTCNMIQKGAEGWNREEGEGEGRGEGIRII